MKNKYAVKDLISGNIICTSPYSDQSVPIFDETERRFIFERQMSFTSKPKYKEVFTGAILKLDTDKYKDKCYCANFNEEYIKNEKDITNYLTEKEKESGYISKFRLLRVYNLMNFKKEIVRVKTK